MKDYSNVGFSLSRWKNACGNKKFELVAYLPRNDVFNQVTRCALELKCNGLTKFRYTGFRFHDSREYQAFLNVLYNNNKNVARIFVEFHQSKTFDVLSLAVVHS